MGYSAIRKCRWHGCGRTFIADHPSRIYCSPECRKKAKYANVRRYHIELKKKQTHGYAPRTTSTLSDAVIDLEEYNRTHGTHYSYGQAVSKGII